MPYFAAAGFAVSLFGASSSSKSQKKAAKAQQRAYEMETEMKLQAVKAQVEDINARREEEAGATADRMGEIARQALISRARYAAAASDGGLAGTTISGIYMATYLEEARARGHEIKNFESKNKQLNRDIRAAKTGLQVQPRPSSADTTATWVDFASQALTIGHTYAQNRGWVP